MAADTPPPPAAARAAEWLQQTLEDIHPQALATALADLAKVPREILLALPLPERLALIGVDAATVLPAQWLSRVVVLLNTMAGEGLSMDGCAEPEDLMCDLSAHLGCDDADDPWGAATAMLSAAEAATDGR